tara:strand:+ start:639 stop:827 length:189 start_codon:yes stop_codon:yes gene_type:complete
MMKEGPMKSMVEGDTEGVVKQEFITYRKKNGMLVKESTVRNFQSNGDYNDSYYDEPLVSLGD